MHSAERASSHAELGGAALGCRQRGGGCQQRSCPQPSVQNGVPSVDGASTSQQQRGRRSASQGPQVERHRRGHGGISTLCQRCVLEIDFYAIYRAPMLFKSILY